MSYWWAVGLGCAWALLAVILTSCATFNPTPSDVLHKFCAFHSSQIAQVLLTPEQLNAGRVVCSAVGERLGSDE